MNRTPSAEGPIPPIPHPRLMVARPKGRAHFPQCCRCRYSRRRGLRQSLGALGAMLRVLVKHALGVFDSDEVKILSHALDQAWQALRRAGVALLPIPTRTRRESCSPCASSRSHTWANATPIAFAMMPFCISPERTSRALACSVVAADRPSRVIAFLKNQHFSESQRRTGPAVEFADDLLAPIASFTPTELFSWLEQRSSVSASLPSVTTY